MKLQKSILKVHHAINGTSRSPLIEYLSLDRVRELQSFTLTHGAEVDNSFKAGILDLREQAELCAKDIGNIAEQTRLKDKFAELLVFVRLFARDNSIVKIPEKKTSTPDFRVRGGKLFVEFKALNAMGGARTHKRRMDEALDGQIDLERQLRAGRKVAFTIGSYQPWRNPDSKRKYDYQSMSYITESLIDKIAQNLKKEQFSHGPTILLIDLDPFVLVGGHRQYLMKDIVSGKTGESYSGILWHAAFGKPGMAMKRIVDFEGQSNKDLPLNRTGILWDFDYVKGLIVQYNGLFLGLAVRTKDSLKTIDWIEKVCHDSIFVNPPPPRKKA